MAQLSLLPEQDGYSYLPAPQHLRAQLSGPAGRYGRGVRNGTARVQCNWRLDPQEVEEFTWFYERHADAARPFEIDLLTERNELRPHAAFFQPETLSVTAEGGAAFLIGAVLQAAPL